MSLFPTEPTSSNVASKHEELEQLYACVSKVIYEGLAKYEKLDQGLVVARRQGGAGAGRRCSEAG